MRAQEDNKDHVVPTLFDFIKNFTILTNFIVLTILQSGTSFVNYLISFYMKYAGGDYYLNKTFKSLGQMLARFVGTIMERTVGIRIGFIIA